LCCGPPEGGPKHGSEARIDNSESRRRREKKPKQNRNRENERTKPKRQNNGERDAKVLDGHGGGG
jgi:hypothetical protein